ncbi:MULTISPECIES: asparagine synthase (glutamine-hydrolyzing) [Rahnella]|uniref:asparagine synthase (glutamine-hydrolyzing) n=1 Tax=Rahnella laticis TaxID=2787622 RepID=A0ABS0E3G9_9GAMM|nr:MULTISPECIES: asparagine synthase (glutamine-hydrolyzing) [Rahnella]MBF7979625.1 asparagine synthase (glutamine-hydrolyzing) [Rahnella laticis]MBF7999715.1 asparagine synthase (glutamine-hydrolyzing) [Rahnella sp. LAC-M12]
MCGILFSSSLSRRFSLEKFNNALISQAWRGPDNRESVSIQADLFIAGHNRLAILDKTSMANQPMYSSCGNFLIVFNGEIYNHLDIRKKLSLNCRTTSDTETLVEAFSQVGISVLSLLDGMFSFVVLNINNGEWFAARDHLGIKPLYYYRNSEDLVIASESSTISKLTDNGLDSESMIEWTLIRRPLPGFSFYKNINELLPGHYLHSRETFPVKYWQRKKSSEKFEYDHLEYKIKNSINRHELSDYPVVALLSGGIDSSIISAISNTQDCYSIGLEGNNECAYAQETGIKINKNIHTHIIDENRLLQAWEKLILLRNEPISVPNEALIYLICKEFKSDQKVLLTGEGADEIFFGYDKIYRWAMNEKKINPEDFISRYGYGSDKLSADDLTERMHYYLVETAKDKSPIEFLEDFMLDVHLVGLLRRMDYSSMAASKEARVPFVCTDIVNYMYRRPTVLKIDEIHSKIPLRKMISNLGLLNVLERTKIGFSASKNNMIHKYDEYEKFRNFNIKTLGLDGSK